MFVILLSSIGANAQIISTICGNGVRTYTGDGGIATAATNCMNTSFAYDRYGNLYFTENEHYVIRKIDTTGVITTVCGNGDFLETGNGVPATAAGLGDGFCVASDASGNLYVGGYTTIRKVNVATGLISVIGGMLDSVGYSGDGGPATAAKLSSGGCAVDAMENIYISSGDIPVIRKINSSGIITTIAGTGVRGYSGDGGAATAAKLHRPGALAVDKHGNVYYADFGDTSLSVYRIRRIDATTGIITTVAGTGTMGYTGAGGPATAATIGGMAQLTCDTFGNLIFGDQGYHTIRKINMQTGVIAKIAGTTNPGFTGDGGPATAAEIHNPLGIAVDPTNGAIAFSDGANFRIRRIKDTARPTTAVRRTIQQVKAVPVISPNPSANGLFTVRFATAIGRSLQLRVYSISGMLVKEAVGNTLSPLSFQLHEPPGTYFVTLIAGNDSWRQQVVVTGN